MEAARLLLGRGHASLLVGGYSAAAVRRAVST
jgi:hypothetical protein